MLSLPLLSFMLVATTGQSQIVIDTVSMASMYLQLQYL